MRLTIGACVSRIANFETVVLLPALSVATMVIVFTPSFRFNWKENAPIESMETEVLFILSDAKFASTTVPLIVID